MGSHSHAAHAALGPSGSRSIGASPVRGVGPGLSQPSLGSLSAASAFTTESHASAKFPLPKKAGYAKFPNPASRYAMIGVFVADTAGGVRASVTGAGSGVFRAKDVEAALGNGFASASLNGVKVSAKDISSDLHASAEYRAHLITVMAKRAVDAAK